MAQPSFPYKKISKVVYQKPSSVVTEDSVYWNKLGSPTLVKEFGAIDYLDFRPVEPYYFAATCSVRVQIYDPITKVVAKNISKFVQAAYGGTFRGDGRLLVAGSEDATVKLFDVSSKNVLRVFTGHTAPVHRTYFTKDQLSVLSYSDDKSVCMWDIATEQKTATFSEHTDYVRAGAPSPVSPNLFLSGSYDHTVKLYDSRTNETILTVNHESPVESTLFLPSGGIFISAGGTEIKVWDMFNNGKLLANISQHHKTVTSLCLASNNSRLMSGSLDRHIKIYDIGTFKTIHTIDYPNAVLSMAISERDDILAVGMIDGIISIRKRNQPSHRSTENKGLFKFAPDHIDTTKRQKKPKVQVQVDTVIKEPKKAKGSLTGPENYLRKMQFSKALTAVLIAQVTKKYPETTISMIQELLRRKVLHLAIEELQEKYLVYLLKFLIKYIGETRFSRVIIDATNVFIDVFENEVNSFSENVMMKYRLLQKQLASEIEVCQQVSELEGAICLLLAGAQTSTNVEGELNHMAPSFKAQKEIVINV